MLRYDRQQMKKASKAGARRATRATRSRKPSTSKKSKRTAKGGQEKQSNSPQRQRREKKGPGVAETGAGASSIPVSQISHKKRAISRADWLKDEWDFRNVNSSGVEACCYYEYLRESAAMRGTCVLPTCTDQIARSTLTFTLNKAGWVEAAKNNEPPSPWNSLDGEIKRDIARCVKRCLQHRIKHPKWHRPLLVQEFLPGHDPAELESQLEKWKEEAYYAASGERGYFFGLFRLDETYNETEASRAFRAWFRKRYGKTKGGNRERSRAKLNDLVVMRLWKRFPRDPIKRVEHIARFTTTGFSGCKEYWEERCKAKKAKLGLVEQRMSKAANEEMSRARGDALKFFQSLFPGERPLSY